MCGRYALAWRPRQIRQALIGSGMQVEYDLDDSDDDDDEDEDDARVRSSYNVAPGYFEPVYRAVADDSDRDDDNSGEGGAGRGSAQDDVDMQGVEEGSGGHDQETEEATDERARKGEVKYILQPMKWGLIPFWTKRNPDYGSMLKTINCRDDSLYDNKGMWTSMKNKKRCIVVAQGFFEWLKKGKAKVPHYTKRIDGQLLCMAGLWDSVKYEDSEETLFTYTIITTSSSKQLSFLHDRMPVIFDPGSEEINRWLDPHRRWGPELQKLLKPYENAGLECYPVKKEVGKVGNNSASFIVPLDSEENKGNIKNFFTSGAKNNKGQQWGRGTKKEEEEQAEDEKAIDNQPDDTRETRDDEAIHTLDPENNAPLPVPAEHSPEPSPTKHKSAPTTPLMARTKKRKLDELSPATSLPPREETDMAKQYPSPSPLKRYSSTETGGGPKKGVFGGAGSSPLKKLKAAPGAREIGNKDITSFFGKK